MARKSYGMLLTSLLCFLAGLSPCHQAAAEIYSHRYPQIELVIPKNGPLGTLPENLRASDFFVMEDGSYVQIQSFQEATCGAGEPSVAFVVDSSGSISTQQMADIKNTLRTLIYGGVFSRNARYALIDFDSTPRMVQGFTADRNAIDNALAQLTNGGGTDLVGGILLGVNELRSELRQYPQRAGIVLVFSDEQGNNGSGDASAIVSAAGGQMSLFVASVAAGSSAGFLQEICQRTGGQFEDIANLGELYTVFQNFYERSSGEYRLSYRTNATTSTRVTYGQGASPNVAPFLRGGFYPFHGCPQVVVAGAPVANLKVSRSQTVAQPFTLSEDTDNLSFVEFEVLSSSSATIQISVAADWNGMPLRFASAPVASVDVGCPGAYTAEVNTGALNLGDYWLLFETVDGEVDLGLNGNGPVLIEQGTTWRGVANRGVVSTIFACGALVPTPVPTLPPTPAPTLPPPPSPTPFPTATPAPPLPTQFPTNTPSVQGKLLLDLNCIAEDNRFQALLRLRNNSSLVADAHLYLALSVESPEGSGQFFFFPEFGQDPRAIPLGALPQGLDTGYGAVLDVLISPIGATTPISIYGYLVQNSPDGTLEELYPLVSCNQNLY